MLILTIDQMGFAQWESDLQGLTLPESLAVHAELEREGLAQCALGNHCDNMRGACVFCGEPV